MSTLHLPDAFVSRMRIQLGSEWPAFVESMGFTPPVSVRKHPLKEFNWPENFEKVKWSSNGVYLPERPVFTLDPAFQAGAYYVQEASSMLIEQAIRQLCDLEKPLRVLDLAGAPGGKSTLLAELISPASLLLANEVIRSRYQVLRYNLIKWGYPNTCTSNHDSQDFEALAHWFDLVVLDAPCSGEGLFRKDAHAMQEWSPDAVRLCASRQRRILAAAAAVVKPGGILLYSTCTYNAAENSDNARWFAETFGFEPAPLHLPEDWGIESVHPGYQCYPHRAKGEGFYLAAMRKKAENIPYKSTKPGKLKGWDKLPAKSIPLVQPWLEHPDAFVLYQDTFLNVRAIPKTIEPWITELADSLRHFEWGLDIGQIKGKDLIPSADLALSTAISRQLAGVDLDKQTALHFLKKDSITCSDAPLGWVLARYQGLNLGWMKVLKERINNYYPKNWRILMEL